jgi:crotonobetainyl-CoA:carnitine CoA-transferase CaiB-like acyl-CoA transferase
MSMSASALPLAGVRVIEFTHMVMGPACGLILADLGADVIKVEPLQGDSTRLLTGSGAGFFPTFNRNKKSVAIDLKQAEGLALARQLATGCDILVENFRPQAMDGLGLGYEALAAVHPRIVYVSHKGFLPGPYENRTALDEVVQMMGGLAYMTGPEGRPLRAGSSVNDIMGGMFGALAAIAALRERDATGRGQLVQSGLFENCVFLVAQHMLQYAVTGVPAAPMPNRVSAWSVYDVFDLAGGEAVFLAIVSDTQWSAFCDAFGFDDLKAQERYATNQLRVVARAELLAVLRQRLAQFPAAAVMRKFEERGLPFAPIARPEDLFEDPHLNASGGLAALRPIPGDPRETRVPLLPLTLGGRRPSVRLQPPGIGEHTHEVLSSLGLEPQHIAELQRRAVVR